MVGQPNSPKYRWTSKTNEQITTTLSIHGMLEQYMLSRKSKRGNVQTTEYESDDELTLFKLHKIQLIAKKKGSPNYHEVSKLLCNNRQKKFMEHPLGRNILTHQNDGCAKMSRNLSLGGAKLT
jgi:hypothetical protein